MLKAEFMSSEESAIVTDGSGCDDSDPEKESKCIHRKAYSTQAPFGKARSLKIYYKVWVEIWTGRETHKVKQYALK